MMRIVRLLTPGRFTCRSCGKELIYGSRVYRPGSGRVRRKVRKSGMSFTLEPRPDFYWCLACGERIKEGIE
jgi:hypothetical protein